MSALLLHVSGTIPVTFRGTTYRFPLSLWVPHAYPRVPPLVYVTPTEAMVVRPGQHVDPQGQVFHPYLASWPEFWDKSTIEDFISVLSDVFSKEPPVVSRRLPRPVQPPQTAPVPPVPLLPPKTLSRPPDSDAVFRPPLPPPKPHQDVGFLSSGSSASPDEPAPSLTSEITTTPATTVPPSRYDTAPSLPVRSHRLGLQGIDLYQSHLQPESQAKSLPYDYDQTRFVPVALPAVIQSQNDQPGKSHHMPATFSPTGPSQSSGPVNSRWNQETMTVTRQPWPAPASPNILDEPVMLENDRRAVVVAPLPPPNPEKDALLRQLAQTLASMRLLSRQQNESRMEGVRAQRSAMQSAVSAMQSEMSQLTQLSNVLNSNADILRDTLRKADLVIEGSKNHPSPDMDELLVASTVVSNQLYTLVAEERALGDAIFMLGRAVERGRVTPAVFAKMTRSLAREWYLKKALVRRIGQGIGLTL